MEQLTLDQVLARPRIEDVVEFMVNGRRRTVREHKGRFWVHRDQLLFVVRAYVTAGSLEVLGLLDHPCPTSEHGDCMTFRRKAGRWNIHEIKLRHGLMLCLPRRTLEALLWG